MGPGFDSGFGSMGILFTLVPILVMVGFAFVFITLIVRAISGTRRWAHNNGQPILDVQAKVVAKRTDVAHHNSNNMNSMDHHYTTTRYFVTFEVQSGNRMEFEVQGEESGLLLEGDSGMLKFQGTRYLGFTRNTF